MPDDSQTIADDELICAVAELARNGEPINWHYWATRLVTAVQAARLAHCIDPLKWPDAVYQQGIIPDHLRHKISAAEEWLTQRFHLDDVPLSFVVRALGSNAPFNMRKAVQPALDRDAELTKQYAAQEAERAREGRYRLAEAAETIAREAEERPDSLLEKLMEAAQKGGLAVYEPGKRARYRPNVVREYYEEAYWNDLNKWLIEVEPRIRWRFPAPAEVNANRESEPSEPVIRRGEFVEQYTKHVRGGAHRLREFFDGKLRRSGETRECQQFQVEGRRGYYYLDKLIAHFKSTGEYSEVGW